MAPTKLLAAIAHRDNVARAARTATLLAIVSVVLLLLLCLALVRCWAIRRRQRDSAAVARAKGSAEEGFTTAGTAVYRAYRVSVESVTGEAPPPAAFPPIVWCDEEPSVTPHTLYVGVLFEEELLQPLGEAELRRPPLGEAGAPGRIDPDYDYGALLLGAATKDKRVGACFYRLYFNMSGSELAHDPLRAEDVEALMRRIKTVQQGPEALNAAQRQLAAAQTVAGRLADDASAQERAKAAADVATAAQRVQAARRAVTLAKASLTLALNVALPYLNADELAYLRGNARAVADTVLPQVRALCLQSERAGLPMQTFVALFYPAWLREQQAAWPQRRAHRCRCRRTRWAARTRGCRGR